jgi:murein DD-endopeptidase MepM/ murein hydrolase activator NlpD
VVRQSGTPVPNPFAGSSRFDPPVTGSLSNKTQMSDSTSNDVVMAPAASSGTGSISSAPLSAPSGSSASTQAQVGLKPLPTTILAAQPVSSEPKKMAALSPEPTPIVVPQNSKPVSAASGNGKWVAQGGSQVALGDGETISTLSSRYGVPEDAIRGANGLTAKAKPPRGAKLIIPVYVADGTLVPTKVKPEVATKTASLAVTAPADTPAQAAAPVAKTSLKKSAVAEASTPAQVASLETTSPVVAPEPAESAKVASNTGFRWPARGRVIQAFGDKNGVKSTGINISLPQGTPIKAAEAGTVAYAGSEIKGFGNLVMIRHPDGWVSVYGNNSEIKVKRGDEIKRGQIIALSGQSGDVSAPQLHFELRKGSVPVDPVEHLSDD